MKKETYIQVSGIIFAVVAVLHLLRLFFGIPVTFGDTQIPVWVSVIGAIVGGFLAYTAFKFSK